MKILRIRFRRSPNLILCLSLLVLVLASCGILPDDMDVEKALSENRVTVELTPTGTYGDVITVKSRLASDTSKSVNMSFPTGLLLQNGTDGHESYVLYKYKGKLDDPSDDRYEKGVSLVLLSATSDEYALLEAYSINAMLDPGDENDQLMINGKADTDVLAILEAKQDVDDIEARQMALWAITDNVTQEDLDSISFKYDDADLTTARELVEAAKFDPSNFELFQ